MKFNVEKYILKPFPLFDLLPEEEKHYAEQNLIRKKYKKGQKLFDENNDPKGVFIIEKGKVKTYQTGSQGKESIVNIYKKGDCFGYGALLADDFHAVSSAAINEVEASFISGEAFLKLLSRSNMLTKKLLAALSKENAVFIYKTTAFSIYPVKERVAIALLILNRVYKSENENPENTVIAISREDFAAFVGAARETVVRVLRIFKNEGIISAKGKKIELLKPDLLLCSLLKKESVAA